MYCITLTEQQFLELQDILYDFRDSSSLTDLLNQLYSLSGREEVSGTYKFEVPETVDYWMELESE